MLTMSQSLQSFSLHHFLSPDTKMKFLHEVESLSPCLICTLYMPLSLASSEQQFEQASKGIGKELTIRENGKQGGRGGVEKEEKRRLIYKNHLSFVSAAAGGCKFPFGSSFSFRFPLIVITPSCSLFAPGSRSLHFVINFSLLICNILATLYTLNFSNNPLRKSQCIRLSHFLMNVFKLGKPEYFLPIGVTASSIKICDIYLISKTCE